MSDRTFTLDEAQSLLPVLESLLRTAIAGKKLMEEVDVELQAVNHRIFLNGGTHLDIVPLARRRAERPSSHAIMSLRRAAQEARWANKRNFANERSTA